MEQSQSSFGVNWYSARLLRALLNNKNRKPSSKKMVAGTKFEYPSDVLDLTVVKPVNEVFANAINYRNVLYYQKVHQIRQ